MRVAAAAIFCDLLPAVLPVPAADGQNETALDCYVAAAVLKWATPLIATIWLSLRRWYGAPINGAAIERQLRLNRRHF